MAPHCLAALAGLLAVTVPAERADFDCPMRDLALEYAAYIQPFRPAEAFQQLTDALNGSPEKVPNCTVPSLESNRFQSNTRFQYSPLPAGGNTFYADPIYGNDRNPGTESQPFKTIDAALNATRQTDAGKNTIVLRNGTFYQASTVTLGIQDSGLTIQAYPNETVWISGAAPLTQVTWTPRNVSTGPVWTVAQSTNYVFGDVPSPYVLFNGTYDSWGGCQAACEANFSAGGPCTIWTWHDTTVEPEYQLHCYFRIDGRLVPTVDPGHVSGNLGPGMNVWQASLAGTSFTSVLGLRWNARRMIRARFPNSDPETDGFGAFFYANSWTAQTTPRAPDVQIDLPSPVRNTSKSMFQTFTAGVGGTCDRFQPAAGYWCSNAVQGGGSVIYYAPSAMQVNQSILPHTPYANPIGAVVQTWRPGFWCSWMMEVSSATFNPIDGSTNFSLPWGAFQGSRGADAGEGTYVENVMEELDAPAEWFFNTTTQMLYLWHNASAGTPPPLDGSIVLTQIKHLFNVTGTQDAPVTDITFSGLGFRDTSYTYLDPHGIPSGGDWALERSAVLFFEGTERVNVSGSVFERVDGNAIVLSAYNRNATIAYNEFYYIGSTAIAQWGNTDGGDPRLPAGYGQDGTSGDQPRGTRIMYNLCHELGIWEKQSSFYTQFKSGRNHLEGNIVYNGPRAHINFNDGFLGGSLVTRNLVFNSCRESSDHGPFNSWDRDPYVFDDINGTPTFIKQNDEISNNFIIANGAALGAIDNDDGSSYYYTHDNFFVYGGGGLKNDFEGHNNIHVGNIYAWVSSYGLHNGYGGTVGTPGEGYLAGHQPVFYSNKVILSNDGDYAKPVCSGVGSTTMYNNSVYSPTGTITECGTTLVAWQAAGNDPGTTAQGYPLTSEVISWARAVLWV